MIFSLPGCPIRISSQPSPPRAVVNNRLSGSIGAVGVLRERAPVPTDPCVPSPCGVQAQCRSTGNRAVSREWGFFIGNMICTIMHCTRSAAVLLVSRAIPTQAAPKTLATLHHAEKTESARETVRVQPMHKILTTGNYLMHFVFPLSFLPSFSMDDLCCVMPPLHVAACRRSHSQCRHH